MTDVLAEDVNWLAESLRLTMFSTGADGESVSATLFRDLTGQDPEVTAVHKAGPAQHEHGQLAGTAAVLSCDRQPGRWDIALTPILTGDMTLAEFPNIGNWRNALEFYRRLMLQWIDRSPPCNRIAVGAIALRPAADRVAGYRALQQFLPDVRIDAEHSMDFSYTINRPRQFEIDHDSVRINRLSKWSVARLSGVQFQVSGATTPVQVTPTGVDIHACRVELDINTAAERVAPLPKDAIAPMFSQLVESVIELLDKGDVR